MNADRSPFSTMLESEIERVKLGHPLPDANLSVEEKRTSPETTSTYKPSFLLFQYSFSNGRSVPSSCVTWYCNGVSFSLSAAFSLALFGLEEAVEKQADKRRAVEAELKRYQAVYGEL